MINAPEVTEIIHSNMKRKRWTPFEKQQIVNETYHHGVSVSFIARKHSLIGAIPTPLPPLTTSKI
ncbi:Transposase [Legionella nautarum]|uniref:Transposase n=2 Tax=Legionella nautarum TaxID=45070 RepID=A0A0W0WZN6_9GAMM|nr:Transposase [Legionella nautarum]